MNTSRTVLARRIRHNTYAAVAKFPSTSIPTIHGTLFLPSSTTIHAPTTRNPRYKSSNVTIPHRSAHITLKISSTFFSSDAHTMSPASNAVNAPTITPNTRKEPDISDLLVLAHSIQSQPDDRTHPDTRREGLQA